MLFPQAMGYGQLGCYFYPTAFKGCVGLFSNIVSGWLDGQTVGQMAAGRLSRVYLRNRKV